MGLFGFGSKEVVTDEARIEDVLTRGVVEVISREKLKEKLLSGKRLRIKLGIDPTSPNLHLGRAIQLLKLRDFQELGHQIVLIIGDFTAVIGDTSDKDAERPMLAREVIEKNMREYKAQAGKLLDMSQVEFRRNSEWLEKLNYREIGEHADLFSVSDFISRENIKRRLDTGKRVSLREVLYPLMQGYDSVAIEADVELGGTDQRFNLLSGRSLQEKFGQRPQDIVMGPLINGLDGRKMSSSWGNVINLTDEPSDMYGKVMSMHDEQVGEYFEYCTRVPMQEVSKLIEGLKTGSVHPKDAKMRLAREIVTLYHGPDEASKAENAFTNTFALGGIPTDLEEHVVVKGTPLKEALLPAAPSASELMRLFKQSAIETAEGKRVTDPFSPAEQTTVYRIGKRRFLKVVVKE